MIECADCGVSEPKRSNSHVRCQACSAKRRRVLANAYNREWAARNKESVAAKNKRWRSENLDRYNEKDKEWRAANRDKLLAQRRDLRKRNPERTRDEYRRCDLKRKYGLTTDEYASILAAQGHACAICRGACKTGRNLAVDHDHETGVIRGLLCADCNRAIGMFQDSPDLLFAAIRYLQQERRAA